MSIENVSQFENRYAIKRQVTAVSTGNDITLTGEQTIDGVSILDGDRVLLRSQSNTVENGIYVARVGQWSRADDFLSDPLDTTLTADRRMQVAVRNGNEYAGTLWELTNATQPVIGLDAVTFALTQTPITAIGSEKTDPDGSETFPIEDAGSPKYITISNADEGMVISSTVDPSTNDDALGTAGNGECHVGRRWINTVDDKTFMSVDSSSGAAVWREQLHTGYETLSTGGAIADTARTHWLASTSGGLDVSLPDPSVRTGDEHVLTCLSSAFYCSVSGSINGSTDATEIIYPGESFSMKSDGNYWRISG